MKKIYDLAVTLAQDPAQVTDAQALTLDDTRPGFGFKGVYGLFGSDEWWGNLKAGRIPTVIYEGEIESLQFEGMHNEGRSFTLRLTDGGSYKYSCVANEKSDMGAYAVGRKVRVTTYSEPMKSGSDLEFVWMVEIDCD
ncbi:MULTISPECIES: hypothetical protein [Hyphomonas]|uniref:Uncharacterized protein n=1 Tax=Hyphomonas adhaerens TaxID=81029 RepID=A0A3B9GVN1_9PROT|nr:MULTISPECIES: hypothetical protein [Hyphomonas]MBB41036.1 hypothetical protein [Hyphomonas sp.]HAE26493.1 hypothetical protein [Hyphomonas adhaerens]|tara:strand:- start:8545 stop:8958 length:414 start_codon:yes stop_codon:yes gene_type:complete